MLPNRPTTLFSSLFLDHDFNTYTLPTATRSAHPQPPEPGLARRGARVLEKYDAAAVGEVNNQKERRSLISGYAQVGIAEKAVEVFSTKKDFDCRSDVFIYNSVLPVMVQKQVLLLAIAVYNQMLKLNCHSNVTTYSILIDGLCKNGITKDAFQLFDEMTRRGERLDESLKLLNLKKERGQCPDVITYNALLNGFCKFGRVDEAYGLLETFEKDAYDLGLHGYSCLIDDAGRVKEALKLFYEMTERNLVPDTYCYNALIKGFCGLGLLDMAQSLRLEISKNGCFPDACTYTILICGMCRNGLVGEEKQIFKEMEIGEGRNPSLFLRLSQGANQVLDKASLQTMAKSINGAFKLFKDLQLKGLSPDSVTYGTLIDGLQRLDTEADAFGVFDQMERNGCMPSFTVYKSLMTCLCRKNKISLAFSLWLKYLRNLSGSEEEAIKAVEEHFEKGEVEKAI
nr:pentatricopeptide repeat-containing protein [Quercus suber]